MNVYYVKMDKRSGEMMILVILNYFALISFPRPVIEFTMHSSHSILQLGVPVDNGNIF